MLGDAGPREPPEVFTGLGPDGLVRVLDEEGLIPIGPNGEELNRDRKCVDFEKNMQDYRNVYPLKAPA